MASLRGLLQGLLDKTDLDERAAQYFKPKTGTLAKQGQFAAKQFSNNALDIINRTPQRAQTFFNISNTMDRINRNPVSQIPIQFMAGNIEGSNAYLTKPPTPKPFTPGGGTARIAGNLVGAMNPYGLTGKITRTVVGATNPVIARGISKLPVAPGIAGAVTNRLAAGAGNVGQGIAIDRALNYKTTPASLGIDLVTGAAFGPKQFDITRPKSNFTMDKYTLDELVQAEEMLRNPKNFLGKIPTAAKREKEALKEIQQYGYNMVERISARHLPTKQIESLKSPYAKIKALADLNSQNRLANVEGIGFVNTSQKSRQANPQYSPQAQQLKGKPAQTPLETQAKIQPGYESSILNQNTQPPTRLSQRKLQMNNQQSSPALESIIAEGKKSIGTAQEKPGKNVKQTLDTAYTQWVDRFHPLSQASKKAKSALKQQGAMLRPESDPDYLVRRLTGAGAVADYRFKTKLNPILKEFEQTGIAKADMDTYLAHNRMLGFDQVGRKVYGVDPEKSKQVVQALEQKYPGIQNVAQKFYQYQDEGLQELAQSGFFTQADIQAMRSQNPNYAPLYRVMDEMNEYLGLPTRKTMQGTSPIKKIKGSTKQIESPVESIIGNTFSQRAAIEKNRVAQSIVNLNKVADMGFEKVSKSAPDTITVWNNGKKEYWKVGQDIADVAKGTNEEAINLLLKIAQAPAQLLRQGATGRNPAFMIPNMIRDQLDAGISSKYGYIPFVDYVSGLKSMLTNDEAYQSWQKSGAKIDLGELSGKKSIQKMFDQKVEKKKLSNWLTGGLDVMGKYSEQPTRVGLYKKALNKTGNELLAAMESRDSTVDFARMGSKMKVANSIIPFLNVGVQGFDKLIRAVKNNPGKVMLNLGLYAATPAAAITAYNIKNYPEEYAEIPQYDKDDNFVIVKGRNPNGTVDYLTIPKGNIVPVVANPIQSFMEHLAGVDGKSFGELATSVLSETLPVLEQGNTPKEVLAKTSGSILPQIIKPVVEDVANRQFYKYDAKKEAQGKDSGVIVPYYLKDKPAYQQTYEFTPQMYQKIGAAINVSPLRVKALMESYLAGYSKIPAQIVQMMYNSSRGETISPNDKTVLSRFIKQTYPTSGTKSKPKPKTEVPGFMDRMTGKVGAVEEIATPLPTNTEDLAVLYKDANRIIGNYQENKVKSQYGLVEKDLADYQTEVDAAIAMKKRIEAEAPEKVFEIELDTYNKDGGASTEDRAAWAAEQLKNGVDVEKLYTGQVLTKSVVELLNEQYGTDLKEYNYGSTRKSLGGSGKKGKKISFKLKSPKTIKPTKFTAPKATIGAMPKITPYKITPFKIGPVNTKIATSKINTTIKPASKLRMKLA